MSDNLLRGALVATVVVALLGGSAVVLGHGPLSSDGAGPTQDGPAVPAVVSLSSGCPNETDHPGGGWLAATEAGQQKGVDVTVNVTVAHGPGVVLGWEVVESSDGVYEFRLRTRERTRSSPLPREAAGCPVRTQVEANLLVPPDFDTVRVRIDGDVVGTVEGPGGRQSLPNPVNSTSSE